MTQLARKRQKKRLYKGALLQETADLQATIVDRDGRIADLNGRIDQVQGLLLIAWCSFVWMPAMQNHHHHGSI